MPHGRPSAAMPAKLGEGAAVPPFAGNSIGMAMTHGRVAGKLITGREVL